MSIVPLVKVSILAKLDEKNAVLSQLQDFGELHLIHSATKNTEHASEQEGRESSGLVIGKLKKSLRYLEDSPIKRKQALHAEELDVEEIVNKVLANKQRKRELSDQYESLCERENTIKPWGSFQLPELKNLGGIKLWFYLLPHKYKDKLEDLHLPWEIVHRDHHFSWLILLSREEPNADLLPVERLHMGKQPLEKVLEKRLQVELDLEDLEVERQNFSRYISVLKRMRARAEDQTSLGLAKGKSLDLDKLFISQAWIAKEKIAALKALAEKMGFALYVEEVSTEDQPPTKLSNPPFLRGGEMLVSFYQTPAYRAWDPSAVLFVSFALFFAMILSDAAYALILLLVLLVYWRKLGRSQKGISLRPLLACICSLSLIWGMIMGSYFGEAPVDSGLLGTLHVLDINNYDSMMILSLACGVLHILLANLSQCYVFWGRLQFLKHLGFVLLILAGVLYALSQEIYVDILYSSYLSAVLGIAFIFASAGDGKWQNPRDFFIRCLQGFRAMANISGLFGDVLSYLRLFALGLASASLAFTFNSLAKNALDSESGLSLLFALLILLVGHSLNLFLAIVSGVVHGLRLNFIEFYNWALEGEGYPFTAFQKQENLL